MATIPIRDVPGDPVQPSGDELILIDNGIQMQKATINDAVTPKATEIAEDKIADLNLGTASQSNVEDFATAAQGLLADSAVQPGDLATVATSGDYEDLQNKPTLGTAAAANIGEAASDVAAGNRGLPSGGGTGEVLVKNSESDYDAEWREVASATAVSYAPQTLDPSEQAQARANIGIVLQSSATDTTAGRVLTVGAFGIGAPHVEVETDLDNYNVPGFYITPASGLTNLPAGWSQARHALIVSGGTAYALQIIAKTSGGNTGQAAYRTWSGTAWSNWQTLFNSDNILGTVSQSGGTPTGAIIERGSNANGEYVRYADGTQICHFYGTVTDQAINAAYGSSLFYGNRAWTFPAQFASGHIVAFHQGRLSTGASWSTLSEVTTTAAVFRFIDSVSRSTGSNFVLNFAAIGRWF